MTDEDGLSYDPKEPCVAKLIEEFKRCSPDLGYWNRFNDNERTRFALWANQSRDCRKHATADFPAKPWNLCSDQRVFMADEVINDDVALCCNSFWRALVHVQGVGIEDAGGAAVANRVIEWFIRNAQSRQLSRDVELSAQYMLTYGWCVLQPKWIRNVALRNAPVRLEQLEALAPGATAIIMDPSRNEEATALLQANYRQWCIRTIKDAVEELPSLSKSDAAQAVSDLQNESRATLPLPYIRQDQPCITPLRPWSDVFIPRCVAELDAGRAYVRDFYTEEQLRARIQTDGWNEEWVEAAIKTKGSYSTWPSSEDMETSPGEWTKGTLDDNNLIEVIFAYSQRLDRNLIPGIYLTVFNAEVTKGEDDTKDLVGKHGLLDYAHGEMPAILMAREWLTPSASTSRGVPELTFPAQRMSKVQQDALVDRTSLTTLPPRLVPPRIMMEEKNIDFGPNAAIPTYRGEEPKFMTLPGHDGVAEAILRYTDEKVDSYFGRASATVPATKTQVRQQKLVNSFLQAWTAAFQQEWALIQQYMSSQDWQRLTGTEKPTWGPMEIGRGYDTILTVDVRDLDLDFTIKKLEAVSKFVSPEDKAGVIDQAALVRMKLMAIDPQMAKQLVVNRSQASQKLFQDVNLELASMFLGNPPSYVENDPTAEQQLMFAQQIVQSNPKYQAALTADARFSEAIQSWADNRMQSVKQQKNKQVGRLGVEPIQ